MSCEDASLDDASTSKYTKIHESALLSVKLRFRCVPPLKKREDPLFLEIILCTLFEDSEPPLAHSSMYLHTVGLENKKSGCWVQKHDERCNYVLKRKYPPRARR